MPFFPNNYSFSNKNLITSIQLIIFPTVGGKISFDRWNSFLRSSESYPPAVGKIISRQFAANASADKP